jgi:lysophospholipase L1-like esterase
MTRPLLRLLGTVSAALLVPALLAPPAQATKPGPVVLDGLGDSYASGVGAPPYWDTCGRSAAAPAPQLDGRVHVELDDFVACGGATTTSLVEDGQLAALGEDTDLVTLSIGGNDIGWFTVVAACLGGSDPECAAAVASTRARITDSLPGLLDTVYEQIGAAAPTATVVVTGYPRLFSPEYGAYFRASAAEQRAMNDGADLLNSVIADRASAYGFTFVDVTRRFDGHGVNAPESWIVPPGGNGTFHPDEDGYDAYAGAVTSAVARLRLR